MIMKQLRIFAKRDGGEKGERGINDKSKGKKLSHKLSKQQLTEFSVLQTVPLKSDRPKVPDSKFSLSYLGHVEVSSPSSSSPGATTTVDSALLKILESRAHRQPRRRQKPARKTSGGGKRSSQASLSSVDSVDFAMPSSLAHHQRQRQGSATNMTSTEGSSEDASPSPLSFASTDRALSPGGHALADAQRASVSASDGDDRDMAIQVTPATPDCELREEYTENLETSVYEEEITLELFRERGEGEGEEEADGVASDRDNDESPTSCTCAHDRQSSSRGEPVDPALQSSLASASDGSAAAEGSTTSSQSGSDKPHPPSGSVRDPSRPSSGEAGSSQSSPESAHRENGRDEVSKSKPSTAAQPPVRESSLDMSDYDIIPDLESLQSSSEFQTLAKLFEQGVELPAKRVELVITGLVVKVTSAESGDMLLCRSLRSILCCGQVGTGGRGGARGGRTSACAVLPWLSRREGRGWSYSHCSRTNCS